MLSVDDAQKLVFGQVKPLPPRALELHSDILGMVLAEDVVSDLDLPPYDKALMDGYAVRSADFVDGQAELDVIEEVTAGKTPQLPLRAKQATRIMTGAPIPANADAVVMVESSQMLDDRRVRLIDPKIAPERSILRQGREMRCGDAVLLAGCLLRPQEIGVLSAVGRTGVRVFPRPSVAVIPTGDEIVEVRQRPGPGQIRNSNGPMILAQASRAGGEPHFLGIARDNLESLRDLVGQGLRHAVLVLSGGVSAGKLDLVPGVLEEMGVRPLFHKVNMKPGRPMYFGIKEHSDRPPTYVFGLPGNPVSSLVCFELFVRPAIRGLRNLPMRARSFQATLSESLEYKTDRPTYYPAHIVLGDLGLSAKPFPWFGSPDLKGVLASNGFLVISSGEHRFVAGAKLPVLLVEDFE